MNHPLGIDTLSATETEEGTLWTGTVLMDSVPAWFATLTRHVHTKVWFGVNEVHNNSTANLLGELSIPTFQQQTI